MTLKGHLFLIGFMGAGKTTVARILGERLHRDVIDLDEVVEQRAGKTVADVFRDEGEEAFRDSESAVLSELGAVAPAVIACGGGVVLRSENRAVLKQTGTVIYLAVTPGEALARIGDTTSRPLLSGAGGQLAATSILSAREGLYRSAADAVVDTVGKAPDSVADEILALTGAGT